MGREVSWSRIARNGLYRAWISSRLPHLLQMAIPTAGEEFEISAQATSALALVLRRFWRLALKTLSVAV